MTFQNPTKEDIIYLNDSDNINPININVTELITNPIFIDEDDPCDAYDELEMYIYELNNDNLDNQYNSSEIRDSNTSEIRDSNTNEIRIIDSSIKYLNYDFKKIMLKNLLKSSEIRELNSSEIRIIDPSIKYFNYGY
jgi:hypothetical protein